MTVHRFPDLPVIPASRSIRPYDYIEPVRLNENILRTCSGVVIGGAIPADRRRAANDNALHLRMVVLSKDAEHVQRALLNPRTAPNPTAARIRAALHELRTDVKARRILRARVYRALVLPVIRWL